MLDFNIELVSDQQELISLIARLDSVSSLSLDIETVNWWDRETERVALIQLAFREGHQLQVVVIDALAEFAFEPLRAPLELGKMTKAIHNAAYDAVRLFRHFRIHTFPIHDTMLAARRNGEKRYSLQSQAQIYLGLRLDKSEQRGDWAKRPLTTEQLRYAALDALSTLLLYEDQLRRGWFGHYHLSERTKSPQTLLPLDDASPATSHPEEIPLVARAEESPKEGLDAPAIALLGVVSELAGHYSPERLAASAGSERVGLAGWIIDRALSSEREIDEETVKLVIAELCELGLVRLNARRRLEATESGVRLWHQLKPT